jgi:serine/threonine-protein kinase HipA
MSPISETSWSLRNGRIARLVVFVERNGSPMPVGELRFEGRGPMVRSRFAYARSWLSREDACALDPIGLPLVARAALSDPYQTPLAFYDAGPDGWGRTVLRLAYPEQEALGFGQGEYLAAASPDRIGEMLFGPSPDGPATWVPGPSEMKVPDGAETLEDLLAAAVAVESGDAEPHHFRLLADSATAAGGARPKVSILHDGAPWIAKFPTRDDPFDDPRAEALCLDLAAACGIDVPDHELVEVRGRAVLLMKRFDRGPAGERFGYLSAGTLLKFDPHGYATSLSYTDIAARGRSIGAIAETELFRRLLFNHWIHNTDDHLRNHAFLRCGTGAPAEWSWRLAPAFDLVPHRQGQGPVRPSRRVAQSSDPQAAFATWPEFGLSESTAHDVHDQIIEGLRSLTEGFDRNSISARDRAHLIDLMPAGRV